MIVRPSLLSVLSSADLRGASTAVGASDGLDVSASASVLSSIASLLGHAGQMLGGVDQSNGNRGTSSTLDREQGRLGGSCASSVRDEV